MAGDFGYGQIGPDDVASELNSWVAIAKLLIAQIDTMKLVKVVAIHPGEGTPPAPGTVDVLPLVNQIDGGGYPTKHDTVFKIPVWRFQFGAWAIVADPAVGDLGYVICSDRDTSLVVKNKAQSNPGSRRRYNVADGVYVGGIANAVPAATMWLKTDGTWVMTDGIGNVLGGSDSGISLTPKSGLPVTVTGNLIVTGNIQLEGSIENQTGATYTGDIKTLGNVISGFGGADAVGLKTHTHTQPNDSHGDTEGPTSAPTAGT